MVLAYDALQDSGIIVTTGAKMEASVLDPKDAKPGILDVKDNEQPQAACADAPAHRISFVSASKMPDDEDAVLTSMCKLLASLLRVPATGDLSAPGTTLIASPQQAEAKSMLRGSMVLQVWGC